MSEEFEKEKICYEQNYLQFRSLNNIMWQVPIIAMTLTGGLWFGVKGADDVFFKTILLILAAVGNTGLIIVLIRIRFVMGEYLKTIESFYPKGFVEAKGKLLTSSKAVVRTFKTLLGLSALISIISIGYIHSPTIKAMVCGNQAAQQQMEGNGGSKGGEQINQPN